MPERATESIKPPAAAAIKDMLSFTNHSFRNTTNKTLDDQKAFQCPALEPLPDQSCVGILVKHYPSAFRPIDVSGYLRQEFPHLLKIPTLWTHAYFYATTGKVSSAIIEKYINDPHHYK